MRPGSIVYVFVFFLFFFGGGGFGEGAGEGWGGGLIVCLFCFALFAKVVRDWIL